MDIGKQMSARQRTQRHRPYRHDEGWNVYPTGWAIVLPWAELYFHTLVKCQFETTYKF